MVQTQKVAQVQHFVGLLWTLQQEESPNQGVVGTSHCLPPINMQPFDISRGYWLGPVSCSRDVFFFFFSVRLQVKRGNLHLPEKGKKLLSSESQSARTHRDHLPWGLLQVASVRSSPSGLKPGGIDLLFFGFPRSETISFTK